MLVSRFPCHCVLVSRCREIAASFLGEQNGDSQLRVHVMGHCHIDSGIAKGLCVCVPGQTDLTFWLTLAIMSLRNCIKIPSAWISHESQILSLESAELSIACAMTLISASKSLVKLQG